MRSMTQKEDYNYKLQHNMGKTSQMSQIALYVIATVVSNGGSFCYGSPHIIICGGTRLFMKDRELYVAVQLHAVQNSLKVSEDFEKCYPTVSKNVWIFQRYHNNISQRCDNIYFLFQCCTSTIQPSMVTFMLACCYFLPLI